MIKDTILQHKQEKEELLSKSYLLRDKLKPAKKLLSTDLIKIITGPRRAGKSVFSLLLLKDENFAYLNFDDEQLLSIKNYDEILKGISEVYPKSKFILFDEIQNLKNWEVFVNKLHRRGYNLVLTGSNAKLLSQELATALTGRHLLTEVFPFSFKEYLEGKGLTPKSKDISIPEARGEILSYLADYMKNGGFPEVTMKGLDARTYLETLFDAILFKDIVKRYRIRYPQRVYDLALYLIANFCSEFSFSKLKNTLNYPSTKTVQNYFGYLEEAYLFFSLNRFSYKMRAQLKAPKKKYIIDNGFILAKAFQFSQNAGRLKENLVLVEILRRGYKLNTDIFYYKTKNNREVDFVLRKGLSIKQLIQSCLSIDNSETKKRELTALVEAGNELGCDDLLVINWDYEAEERFKGKVVKFIPFWKWLLC